MRTRVLNVWGMGELLEYRSPKQRNETTAWLGMVIFLASWFMMFAALFFTYGGIRARSILWPPPAMPLLPLTLPTVNTIAIALSSAVMQYGVFEVRRGKEQRLGPALSITFLLGTVFMGLQTMVWADLYAEGLKPDSGPYGSVFYGLTAIHAAHVVVGLLAIGFLTVRAFAGYYSAARHLAVRLWTMYWHFVGVIWLGLFLSVYVY